MNLIEQKTYVINWIKELSLKFRGAFSYGYNSLTKSHVVAIPQSIDNTEEFDDECERIYREFELPNNIEVLCLPADDWALPILMKEVEFSIASEFWERSFDLISIKYKFSDIATVKNHIDDHDVYDINQALAA